MLMVFWIFYFLYSTVLGASHLARYVIFLMPLYVLIAGRGALWSWNNWQNTLPRALHALRSVAFLLMAGGLAALWAVETNMRLKLGSHVELIGAMQGPRARAAYSDKLYAALGSPQKRPIVLAYIEVQVRYWLDDRFIVRSLDGRTDPALLKYFHQGVMDHIGYIKERKIDYVMEAVDLNQRPGEWSLAKLEKLKPGESLSRDGVRFVCMQVDGRGIFRVE
jgi:hypothetical protein